MAGSGDLADGVVGSTAKDQIDMYLSSKGDQALTLDAWLLLVKLMGRG